MNVRVLQKLLGHTKNTVKQTIDEVLMWLTAGGA